MICFQSFHTYSNTRSHIHSRVELPYHRPMKKIQYIYLVFGTVYQTKLIENSTTAIKFYIPEFYNKILDLY